MVKRDEARANFINLVTKNYYNEFFWFPFTDKFYTVIWNNDGDPTKAVPNGLADHSGEFFASVLNWV